MTSNSSGLSSSRLTTGIAGGLAVTAALLAWLWPIGIGGKMPIGGDVTNFFMGLMAVLGESLREGRLAVWNDLWGYGFPGLAESQMGVFYPPHMILYKFLDTETAYVASLVLHTLWGGLGAFWAGRKLGISSSRFGSGRVFVVHLRILLDSSGPSLGIYNRLLDALGLGAGLVDPDVRRHCQTGRCRYS